MSAPTFTLNNGVSMPSLGFGVFQTPPDATATAVTEALRLGYRHIDTAAAYANERGVGDAIRDSGLGRDEVFIETKIWISDYGYEETLHAWKKSAGKLGVDQIDLLLLHQALPTDFDRTRAAYRALETLLAEGKVRAIGVSSHRGRYYHEYTMSIDVSRDSPTWQPPTADAEDIVTEALRDLARWLYRQLEAEYDHLTSDEAIEEGIIVNEYTFTEAGRRFG